jgi:Fic family protein
VEEIKYIWQLADFPAFYYNQEAFLADEKQFLQEFQKVEKLLNKNTDISTEITTDLGIVETVFNSRIEGVLLDSQNMFDSMLGNSMPNREEKSALLTLKLALDNFGKPLSDQLLKELHKTLLPQDPNAGKYIGDMRIVQGNIYMGQEKTIYRGVPKDLVDAEIQQFIEKFNSVPKSTPIANAVNNHIHFESIHPFCDGNGRIGRILMVMGLCRDLNCKIPLAISRAINSNIKRYYEQFESTQLACSLDTSAALRIMFPILLNALEETKQIIHISNIRAKIDTEILNARQIKAMSRLIMYELDDGLKGGLSNANYCKMTGSDSKQAQRELNKLVRMALLVRTGKLKSTRYYLPPKETD